MWWFDRLFTARSASDQAHCGISPDTGTDARHAGRSTTDALSFSRRRLCLVLPLGLAACGYTPVYAPSQHNGQIAGRFAVAEPRSRDQFLLAQQLERRLGRNDAASYRLDYAVSVSSDALAISVSGARARYNLVGVVTYSLVDTATGQVVFSGRAEDFTAYSAAGTTIATFSAEQDARERLMVTLGDQITTRLLAADLA